MNTLLGKEVFYPPMAKLFEEVGSRCSIRLKHLAVVY